MSLHNIAEALARVTTVVHRRPAAAIHDDAGAVATWDGGTRTVCGHPNGAAVTTDMPREFGGDGAAVSPGWLVRAGLASCASTCIVFAAARQGVVLRTLAVSVDSRSDTRGMLRLADADGTPVDAAPLDLRMRVAVTADDVDDGTLRALVDAACRASPMARALTQPRPMAVDIVVTAAPGVAVATPG